MTQATDDITLLERAYDLSRNDTEWLQEITERVLCNSGCRNGGAFVFDVHGCADIVSQILFVGISDEEQRKILRAMRLLNSYVRAMPSSEFELLVTGTGCRTMSTSPALTDVAGRSALARLQAFWRPRDPFAIIGRNPDGTGIVFSSILPRETRLNPAFRHHWTRIATHLAAAWRLRRALQQEVTAGCTSDGDAIIDASSGRLAHAVGAAQPREARAALRQAVRSIDRARSRLRREDPISAVELWQGLIAGHWSLIDRCDSDGRRYYVAHQNDPQTLEPRALSLRERQVVAYAVWGHANKLIGYELGLDTSTVSNHLRSAQRKLGVQNRIELLRLARLLLTSGELPADELPPARRRSGYHNK